MSSMEITVCARVSNKKLYINIFIYFIALKIIYYIVEIIIQCTLQTFEYKKANRQHTRTDSLIK